MVADRLSVVAESGSVFLLEGGPSTATFRITNGGDSSVVVSPWLSVPRGFRAGVSPTSVRLARGATASVSVEITVTDRRMPRGTLTLHAEDSYAWLSMIATDNWVRIATMTASSHHPDGFEAEWLQDAWTYDDYRWNSRHGWVDATAGQFPDWVTASWQRPVTLSMVRVVTRDGPGTPATTHGVRDYDVQVSTDSGWRTVAEVRGNVSGSVDSPFPEVSTTALRITVLASNDGQQSRLVELEAYGPEGRPASLEMQLYGGPGGPFPD